VQDRETARTTSTSTSEADPFTDNAKVDDKDPEYLASFFKNLINRPGTGSVVGSPRGKSNTTDV
jgi:hypothetical protein